MWKFYQASRVRHVCTFQCKIPITEINQVTVMHGNKLKSIEAKKLDSQNKLTVEISDGECAEYVATLQGQDCEPVK